DEYYEKMNKTPKERKVLMAQMRNYRRHIAPFDIFFDDNESPSTWWFSIEDSFPKNEDHI
ncbi:16725_t:CDS:1, partial [Funneliformis geosporum]